MVRDNECRFYYFSGSSKIKLNLKGNKGFWLEYFLGKEE